MDWNKINTLLSVIHQAAAAGPKYNFIVSLADNDLQQEFNQTPVVENTEANAEQAPPADEIDWGDDDEDSPNPVPNGRRL